MRRRGGRKGRRNQGKKEIYRGNEGENGKGKGEGKGRKVGYKVRDEGRKKGMRGVKKEGRQAGLFLRIFVVP